MTTKTNSVEDGLAELSGVSVCAGPGCHIMLKPDQGKHTEVGIQRIKTCYQRSCLDWAEDQVRAYVRKQASS